MAATFGPPRRDREAWPEKLHAWAPPRQGRHLFTYGCGLGQPRAGGNWEFRAAAESDRPRADAESMALGAYRRGAVRHDEPMGPARIARGHQPRSRPASRMEHGLRHVARCKRRRSFVTALASFLGDRRASATFTDGRRAHRLRPGGPRTSDTYFLRMNGDCSASTSSGGTAVWSDLGRAIARSRASRRDPPSPPVWSLCVFWPPLSVQTGRELYNRVQTEEEAGPDPSRNCPGFSEFGGSGRRPPTPRSKEPARHRILSMWNFRSRAIWRPAR